MGCTVADVPPLSDPPLNAEKLVEVTEILPADPEFFAVNVISFVSGEFAVAVRIALVVVLVVPTRVAIVEASVDELTGALPDQ